MFLDPFPRWPSTEQGRLLHIEPKAETPHHTLSLQHYEVPIKNAAGEVIEWGRHNWDPIRPKAGAPGPLDEKQWERVMEPLEELAALKYKRVVRVRYRHKVSGVVVSREIWQWNPTIFRGGVLIKPFVRYTDGTEALLYLEEWRSTSGKVEISMIDILPSGASQAPLNSAIRELWEEAVVQNNPSQPSSPSSGNHQKPIERRREGMTITLLDEEQIKPHLVGMGQERWMFRVAVHGLEKGVLPVSEHGEANELIKPRLVFIDSKLKHHFERYTEENGYRINPEMKDEIDRIVTSL